MGDKLGEKNNDTICVEEIEEKEPVHNYVPDELIPNIGMEFDTENDAYKFYNSYATYVGFSVRKHKVHYDKSGKIIDRVFCCSCQGHRKEDKRDDDVKRPRAETRFNCKAELRISARTSGKFRVYQFIHHHSHGLVSPKSSKFLRSHRMLTEDQKKDIDMAEKSGIAPKARMELFAQEKGGRENVGFIRDDYKNYLKSKRMIEMKKGDTGGVLEYLQGKQYEDPDFTYAIQVDMDDQVTNIFWTDARMKIDYNHFGDVVCFDTTYRKNKEGRPFGLFVGVNHHKQTVIYGAALLYDETTKSFEWLFRSFADAMPRDEPTTILTDENQAMANAIASTWPKTYHRLCVWHMYQNAAKHLSHVFDKYKSFTKDFSSCVYDYDEVYDFCTAWNEMLDKYDLQNNEWLKRLYAQKEKWALVYGRNTFCADMSSTQRSESMNSQIKFYINYKYDLLRFFQHFERLLEDRRYEESKADTKASQSTPFLEYPVEILKHAASFYTPKVFKVFKKELWKAWNCDVTFLRESENVTVYKAFSSGKPHEHIITFDELDFSISCSCRKFEFAGILCAHSLKVFSIKNVKRVPDIYMLKRWSKEAKVGSKKSESGNIAEDPKISIGRRHKQLSIMFNQLIARAAETHETFDLCAKGYESLFEEIESKFKSMVVEPIVITEVDKNEEKEKSTVKPSRLKFKVKDVTKNGSKRWKSALEKATSKKKYKSKKSASQEIAFENSAENSQLAGALPSIGNDKLSPLPSTPYFNWGKDIPTQEHQLNNSVNVNQNNFFSHLLYHQNSLVNDSYTPSSYHLTMDNTLVQAPIQSMTTQFFSNPLIEEHQANTSNAINIPEVQENQITSKELNYWSLRNELP